MRNNKILQPRDPVNTSVSQHFFIRMVWRLATFFLATSSILFIMRYVFDIDAVESFLYWDVASLFDLSVLYLSLNKVYDKIFPTDKMLVLFVLAYAFVPNSMLLFIGYSFDVISSGFVVVPIMLNAILIASLLNVISTRQILYASVIVASEYIFFTFLNQLQHYDYNINGMFISYYLNFINILTGTQQDLADNSFLQFIMQIFVATGFIVLAYFLSISAILNKYSFEIQASATPSNAVTQNRVDSMSENLSSMNSGSNLKNVVNLSKSIANDIENENIMGASASRGYKNAEDSTNSENESSVIGYAEPRKKTNSGVGGSVEHLEDSKNDNVSSQTPALHQINIAPNKKIEENAFIICIYLQDYDSMLTSINSNSFSHYLGKFYNILQSNFAKYHGIIININKDKIHAMFTKLVNGDDHKLSEVLISAIKNIQKDMSVLHDEGIPFTINISSDYTQIVITQPDSKNYKVSIPEITVQKLDTVAEFAAHNHYSIVVSDAVFNKLSLTYRKDAEYVHEFIPLSEEKYYVINTHSNDADGGKYGYS